MAKKDGLARVEQQALSTTTGRARVTLAALEAERETRAAVARFVAEMMKPETDFGIIPGTDKPTLLKPGAEKLVDLFRCTPRFTLVKAHCREDFERGFFKYTFRVQLEQADSGRVVAEGFGSANSREARYRWRKGERKCPSCGKAAIIAGKAEYGGGWVCFKKKDGCGAKFAADDKGITSQQVGRVPNEDIADLDNTILKMAKKRALVDGAIALARCSDMFTQDVEDLMHMSDEYEPPRPAAAASEAPATKPAPSAPPAEDKAKQNTAAMLNTLVAFGPHKGKPISSLSDDELTATVDFGHEKLMAEPKARWAKAMRENLDVINEEATRRSKAYEAAPAAWEVWVDEVNLLEDASTLAHYREKLGTLEAGTVGHKALDSAIRAAEERLKF